MDKQQEIEENLKEIQKQLKNQESVSPEIVNKLLEESKGSVNFLGLLDKIEVSGESWVVFTDNDEQLLNDNGEFYIQNTLDSTKEKKKIDKEQAKKMYLEYVITYLLNPLVRQKQMNQEINELSQPEVIKEKTIQKTIEKQVKKEKVLEKSVQEIEYKTKEKEPKEKNEMIR